MNSIFATYITTRTRVVLVVNQDVPKDKRHQFVQHLPEELKNNVFFKEILDYDNFFNLYRKVMLVRCLNREILAYLILRSDTLNGYRQLINYLEGVLDVKRIADRQNPNLEQCLRLMILRKNILLVTNEQLLSISRAQYN